MAWAVKQRTVNSGQKLVLLLLANHTNGHTGQCNPSHKLLADECSMGISTLKSHLQSLAAIGLIQIIHKQQDGVALPNQYKLNFEGVGQNLTEGQSEIDRGVGQNLATKQEVKTLTEPVNTVALPFWLPQETWEQFVLMRKQNKKPMTPHAAELMIKKLGKFKDQGFDVKELLEKSIVNCWQDVYEPKEQKLPAYMEKRRETLSGLTRGLIGGGKNVKFIDL